jgi:hypothetical protein
MEKPPKDVGNEQDVLLRIPDVPRTFRLYEKACVCVWEPQGAVQKTVVGGYVGKGSLENRHFHLGGGSWNLTVCLFAAGDVCSRERD